MREITILVAMLAASMQRFEEPVLEAVKVCLLWFALLPRTSLPAGLGRPHQGNQV